MALYKERMEKLTKKRAALVDSINTVNEKIK